MCTNAPAPHRPCARTTARPATLLPERLQHESHVPSARRCARRAPPPMSSPARLHLASDLQPPPLAPRAPHSPLVAAPQQPPPRAAQWRAPRAHAAVRGAAPASTCAAPPSRSPTSIYTAYASPAQPLPPQARASSSLVRHMSSHQRTSGYVASTLTPTAPPFSPDGAGAGAALDAARAAAVATGPGELNVVRRPTSPAHDPAATRTAEPWAQLRDPRCSVRLSPPPYRSRRNLVLLHEDAVSGRTTHIQLHNLNGLRKNLELIPDTVVQHSSTRRKVLSVNTLQPTNLLASTMSETTLVNLASVHDAARRACEVVNVRVNAPRISRFLRSDNCPTHIKWRRTCGYASSISWKTHAPSDAHIPLDPGESGLHGPYVAYVLYVRPRLFWKYTSQQDNGKGRNHDAEGGGAAYHASGGRRGPRKTSLPPESNFTPRTAPTRSIFRHVLHSNIHPYWRQTPSLWGGVIDSIRVPPPSQALAHSSYQKPSFIWRRVTR
ncbi:hypothetical protein B0H10DRAFT_1955128 [Mycena sp. CBHHK59/15]|nr:hypothetical protein B0H10DRAFT_1955128 [Mycena sp. CBHHK59/15]